MEKFDEINEGITGLEARDIINNNFKKIKLSDGDSAGIKTVFAQQPDAEGNIDINFAEAIAKGKLNSQYQDDENYSDMTVSEFGGVGMFVQKNETTPDGTQISKMLSRIEQGAAERFLIFNQYETKLNGDTHNRSITDHHHEGVSIDMRTQVSDTINGVNNISTTQTYLSNEKIECSREYTDEAGKDIIEKFFINPRELGFEVVENDQLITHFKVSENEVSGSENIRENFRLWLSVQGYDDNEIRNLIQILDVQLAQETQQRIFGDNDLDGKKVDKFTRINGKELFHDIDLSAADVGAAEIDHTHDDTAISDAIIALQNNKANQTALAAETTARIDADATKVDKATKVNSKPLSSDITLSAADVGAAPTTHYHKRLENKYDVNTRPATANIPASADRVGSLEVFKATSAMTEGKPLSDGHVIHLNWDGIAGGATTAYDAQLFIPTRDSFSAHRPMSFRTCQANIATWGAWINLIDENTIYTKGTWTPSISGKTTAGIANYTTRIGGYTIIGNQCYIDCEIDGTFTTAPTGQFTISGLPFVNKGPRYTTLISSHNCRAQLHLAMKTNENAMYGYCENYSVDLQATNTAANFGVDVIATKFLVRFNISYTIK